MRRLCLFSAFWMRLCSFGPTCPSAPARASARSTRAWPRSSFPASRLVSWPDWMPCSMRCCWLTLRCTSACMRCDEAEFGLPLAALFSSPLIRRLSWFCARWMRAFSAGLSLPSFAAFDSMRSMRASPLSSCEASRVLSDPLFSPCSMRCCWFTSRCTSEPTVWAEAATENRPATATAMAVAAAFMCASLKFFMKCLPERLTPVPARGLPENGKKCNSLYSTSLRTLTVSVLRGSIARSCRNTPARRVEAGPAAAGPKIESQLGEVGMDPMAMLALATGVFLLTHYISSTPLRSGLVALLGENGYLGLYTLISLVTLGWTIWAYIKAPYERMWVGDEFKVWAVVLMPASLVLIACGALTRNPSAVRQESALRAMVEPRGILRVTRHPILWGIALWAAVHLIARGDMASVILFGGLLLLAISGTVLQDWRKDRMIGVDWQRFASVTSSVPFAALIGGRNQFRFDEIGWGKVLAGLALYFVLLFLHPYLFGARPY